MGAMNVCSQGVPPSLAPGKETTPAQSFQPTDNRRPRKLGLGKPLSFGWSLGPLLVLAYWSVGSAIGLIDPRLLPPPWVAVATGIDLIAQGRLQANFAVSAQRVGEGLFFGVATGVAAALFAGLTRIGGYLLDGLVQIKRAIPIFALIPLLMVWFGIGEFMKIAVIAMSVFFPIYIQTHSALRSIDVRYVELAETLHVGYADFIWHIVLPGAMPGFLVGLRFAVTAAWMALVVVEQTNATSGIGYMMDLARTYAQSDVILVCLFIYGALGLSSDAVVRRVQKSVLSWRRSLEN
jgi:sulfonate transport system permease protein